MLTLTRKVGQKILIGDDIEIIVREIRGRQVRLGIVAPPGMGVFREEIVPASTEDPATADDDDPSDPSEP